MKTVYFDVDTQIDFMFPAGALYVPGAEKIVDRVAALNRAASIVISTMDAHSEDDPEFKAWPPHCIVGTVGQRKPAATLLEKRIVVPNGRFDGNIEGAQQILIEKQTFDCFTNVNLGGVLERLGADRYAVYGVVTEICVKMAALGLLKTGKPVALIPDAARSLSDEASARFIAEFKAAGGVIESLP